MDKTIKKIIVLDMQPIDPPTGGGRLRLLGLYHNLGEHLPVQYIGTYDWPGEQFRDHFLSDTLREVDIPLSDEHFTECRKWQDRVSGKTIIDTTFHQLAHLSPQYIEYARNEIANADIVIFSHPWVYPLVKDALNREDQTVIYDSHNVEGLLRYTLLNDGAFGTEIVREVVKFEYDLCHFAEVILVCSQEDRELFNKLYSVPFHKMKIVPNGVFTGQINPVKEDEKKKIKQQLGLGEHHAAIFIGSNYAPNLEACDFIIKELAPNFPEMIFIIAGGVGNGINRNSLFVNRNVIITGFLSEEEKLLYLAASDLAINPMFSGSGTNIKMFDFMAAGLPIISTSGGARGITDTDYKGIVISDSSKFKSTIQELMSNFQKMQYLGKANRELVEKNYSWEIISPKLGSLLINNLTKKEDGSNPKMALMSSWSIRCGIAEHSRHLVNELELNNVDLWIISNSNTDPQSSYLIDDITKNVYPLWKYDYLRWKDTEIDIKGILYLLQQEGISKLNIQYNLGFFNQQLLIELADQCVKADIVLCITLHNTKDLSFETFKAMSNMNIKIIVHTLGDKKLLDDQGIKNIFHVPLGILEFPDEDKDSCRINLGILGSPVIGSFGFLRPHKGILEAIEAVNILRDQYSNILFLGVNALYPSEDSEQYLKKCNERIDDLKLNENIMLVTDFLDAKQIIDYLHASDVIVLPYHDSTEGSSAAANTAIASNRPIIISKSAIFDEVKNVGYVIDNITPIVLASEIQNVLSSPELLNQLRIKTINYVEENSYATIADKYIEIMDLYKTTSNQKSMVSNNMKNMISTEDIITFMTNSLQFMSVNLPTEIPGEIESHLSSGIKITEETKKIVGDKTHGDYFESSMERYKHYFAIAEAFLLKGAHILDIGNAPGHVGIGLNLLGMKIQGLNLNNLWLDTYPSDEWVKTFNIIVHDIENGILPFDDNLFDAIYFTEVLEHIAVKNPAAILPEFLRVLKPGGIFVLSTPNMCNISNIFSLINGQNIFWPSDIFYGSTDRHNREFTPQEVHEVVEKASFEKITMYGFNCYSNWRGGGNEFAISTISQLGDNHPLLRNTIMLYAFKQQ